LSLSPIWPEDIDPKIEWDRFNIGQAFCLILIADADPNRFLYRPSLRRVLSRRVDARRQSAAEDLNSANRSHASHPHPITLEAGSNYGIR